MKLIAALLLLAISSPVVAGEPGQQTVLNCDGNLRDSHYRLVFEQTTLSNGSIFIAAGIMGDEKVYGVETYSKVASFPGRYNGTPGRWQVRVLMPEGNYGAPKAVVSFHPAGHPDDSTSWSLECVQS